MSKIKVKFWSGYLATFEEAGQLRRSFADSSDDAVKRMRERGLSGVKDAIVEVEKYLGGEVACAVCGKEQVRRHPGHFMCGNSTCRESLIASYKAAGQALTFLSGLNLQDHDIKKQRALTEVVHLLLKALRPDRYGK